jgi:hypothetical protein
MRYSWYSCHTCHILFIQAYFVFVCIVTQLTTNYGVAEAEIKDQSGTAGLIRHEVSAYHVLQEIIGNFDWIIERGLILEEIFFGVILDRTFKIS